MWEPASFLTAMTENKGKWTRTSWGGASRTVSRTTLVKAKRWTSARENGFLEPVKIQGMDIQNDRSYKVNWAISWTRLTTQMHFTSQGHSGLYLLRTRRYIGDQAALLRTFLDSVVASAIFYRSLFCKQTDEEGQQCGGGGRRDDDGEARQRPPLQDPRLCTAPSAPLCVKERGRRSSHAAAVRLLCSQ